MARELDEHEAYGADDEGSLRDHEAPDESDWTDEDAAEQCPACGAEIYADAAKCPACGEWLVEHDAPGPAVGEWQGRPWWWIILGILGIAAVIWLLAR